MFYRPSARLLLAIASPFLLASCFAPLLGAAASGATTAGSGVVLSNVVANPALLDMRARSTQIDFLSPAALLAQNPSLEGYIIQSQCYFQTADPIFLVPDADEQTSWQFSGRLNKDHTFNALEYRSILTLGLLPGAVQLSPWPVQLATLSEMPQMFLQRRLTLLSKVKLSGDDAKELTDTYLEQERRIQDVVMRLESSYNPLTECAAG